MHASAPLLALHVQHRETLPLHLRHSPPPRSLTRSRCLRYRPHQLLCQQLASRSRSCRSLPPPTPRLVPLARPWQRGQRGPGPALAGMRAGNCGLPGSSLLCRDSAQARGHGGSPCHAVGDQISVWDAEGGTYCAPRFTTCPAHPT